MYMRTLFICAVTALFATTALAAESLPWKRDAADIARVCHSREGGNPCLSGQDVQELWHRLPPSRE
jgi:hypothetical protein